MKTTWHLVPSAEAVGVQWWWAHGMRKSAAAAAATRALCTHSERSIELHDVLGNSACPPPVHFPLVRACPSSCFKGVAFRVCFEIQHTMSTKLDDASNLRNNRNSVDYLKKTVLLPPLCRQQHICYPADESEKSKLDRYTSFLRRYVTTVRKPEPPDMICSRLTRDLGGTGLIKGKLYC